MKKIHPFFKLSLIGMILSIPLFLLFSTFSKDNKEYLNKIKLYKNTYLNYEFKGNVIDIIHLDNLRLSWLVIKTDKKQNDIKACCKMRFIKKINDSILKVEFDGMLTYPNYHIKFKKNGIVYKNKGSSAVFYQYDGKTYLLSDIYCPDLSIVGYYLGKDYQYPCDSTIKKITTSKYWYIVKDTLKKKLKLRPQTLNKQNQDKSVLMLEQASK